MKIAIAQINPVIGDFSHNCSRMIRYSEKARARNCDLVVFSELVIPGYPPRDLLEKTDFIQSNLEALQYVMERIQGIGVICGFVEKNPADQGNPLV